MTHTLKAGTILYHGTDNDGFEEASGGLEGPAWLSDSNAVATHFANHSGWGGLPRVISYLLTENLDLPALYTAKDMAALGDEHNLDLSGGREEIRDGVAASGLPGWIIPNNYPEGADILIVDTSSLQYVSTQEIDKPGPNAKPKG